MSSRSQERQNNEMEAVVTFFLPFPDSPELKEQAVSVNFQTI